jgi:hypothetical protein
VNCDRCRDLASEALDGALTGSVRTEFRRHVETCPPCGAFLGELKDSLALLTELPEVPVDAERFDRAVWAAVRSSEPPAAPAWRAWLAVPGGFRLADVFSWRWAPAMAVGTAAVALAVAIGPNSRRAAEPSSFAEAPASLPGSSEAPLDADGLFQVSELNVRAPIPEPVEQYLRRQGGQSFGQDLRFDTGNRLRGSDYFYPVRRLEVNGPVRGATPVDPSYVRPVSAERRPAVIAF